MALLEEEGRANHEEDKPNECHQTANDEDLTASTESDNVNLDEISSFSGSDLDNETNLKTADDQIPQTEATLLNMGFDPELVNRAVKAHGEPCSIATLVDFVIGHSADPELRNPVIEGGETFTPEEELDNSSKLQKMGFPSDVVMHAIRICGDADYNILVDYIIAHELGNSEKEELATTMTNEQSRKYYEPSLGTKLRKKMKKAAKKDLKEAWSEDDGLHDIKISDSDESVSLDESESWERTSVTVSKKRHFEERKSLGRCTTLLKSSKVVLTSGLQFMLPSRMTGFGTPGFPVLSREVDPQNKVPPYFYYEDVASMPKIAWDTIIRHFDGIEPEFVDAKYFCACHRQRGYVHNLPVEGRKLILPQPPMTIQELLPRTTEYWPSWDPRTKFHCINTKSASDFLCKKIRGYLLDAGNADPPLHIQKEILEACSEWNLIWSGPGQPAPLEPHEIELLLGFDEDHTRGASNKTVRIKSLGNSFQIHTIAYHLSVLKALYPTGIRVLSLFSGTGGAEVALHKLGIRLQYVASVENIHSNKLVVESWWKKSGQRGKLKQLEDITNLTTDVLQRLIDEAGGFDLIIGGSPCNDLSGNMIRRTGLGGPDSCLFHEFPRILRTVRGIMHGRKH
ncbi:hypothetical protein O6H91_11G079300 [Diphasiastrum complanatum]|nr:hypothetical protein O6H91_11G079300 [Diphasiastrum complanatum]